MLDALERGGISCARCAQEPWRKATLGCGEPPTEDDERDHVIWRPHPETRQPLSPARAVAEGLPAFEGLGYGAIREDWPWCPRWYDALSEATIDGEPTYISLARAKAYLDKGSLSVYCAPPYTAALFDGLDLLTALENERLQFEHEAKMRDMKARAATAKGGEHG